MDYYLNDANVTNRLITEWNTHEKLIIGVDFDNTLYDYNNKGLKFNDVINLLRECRKIGCYIVIFTSSEEDRYDFIKEYLNKKDIPFDKINEDIEFIQFKGRKIYYNILLDDRAGLNSAYNCLLKATEYKLKTKKYLNKEER